MNIHKVKQYVKEAFMIGIDGYPGTGLPSSASAAGLLELVTLYPSLRKPDNMRVIDGNFELLWKKDERHVAVRLLSAARLEILWLNKPKIGTHNCRIDLLHPTAMFYCFEDLLFKGPEHSKNVD